MGGSAEIWHVQLPSGEVRQVSLDELDEAFQSGIIGARAQVFAPGATEWTTLGAIAGLDEEDEAAAPSPSVNPVRAAQTAAAAPLNLSSFSETAVPPSLAPTAFDLSTSSPGGAEFDLATQLEGDELAFTPKRGRTVAIVAGACAAVAAVALAFGLRGRLAETDLSSATNAVTAPANVAAAAPPPVASPPAAPPPVAIAAAADEPEPSTLAASAPRLTDEQRQLLAEADKARAADIARVEARLEKQGLKKQGVEKAKTKTKAKAKASKKATPKKKQGTPKKAGASGDLDKYDPLNGAL